MRIAGEDWKNIIEAQAQTNKLLQDEETKLGKLGRKLYKEELDSQLNYKRQENRSVEAEHSREREFLQAQHIALHKSDNSKRKEDRAIKKLLAKDYEEERLNRIRQQRREREQEILEEQKRIRDESAQIQAEKQAQMHHKAHLVQVQQEEFRKIQQDKQALLEVKQKEKEHDRRIIQDNILKLAQNENNFREFYRQRQAKQEEKMRAFQPVFRNEQAKWEAIHRSNRKYIHRKEQEQEQELKEKQEQERTKRSREQVKQELNKQINFKQQIRKFEHLKSLREQEQAKREAEKVKLDKEQEVRHKHKLMQDMQRVYESQIKEKRDLDTMDKNMDTRELNYNRQLLHKIQNSQKVAFPGVPGAHSSEPSIQKNFDRVFSKRNVSLKPTPSYGSPVSHKKDVYRINGLRSNSVLSLNKKESFVAVDPNIHNPITNPIGAPLPRVIPGQIAYKGMSSALSRAANSVLNLH